MADEELKEGSVTSDVGVTPPPEIYKGDGVTPHDNDGQPAPPENMEPGPETGHPEGEEPPEGSVVSPAGVTAPPLVYKGDGVTPVEAEPDPEGEGEPEPEPEPEPEAEQASYDDYTVAELKDQAESRGIEVKYDWIKGDIIKALKKADKAEGK